MMTGKNYIGESLSARGSVQYRTNNPSLMNENEWVFTEASEEEINQSCELAWEAFRTYRKISEKDRANFLNAIADEIEKLGDTLLDVYCQESGLPRGRAEGERGRTIFQLHSFAEMLSNAKWNPATIDIGDPNRSPLPKPDIRKHMIPLGPVVVFGSSNFPLAYSTAGGDTASALAAGCPVIVKSHPMHSGTGEMVASAIINAARKTNMPNGVFSNLNSKGIEVGASLVQNHRVKAVGFTGSIRGGRAIYDLANKRDEPIPVFAEMGSINPVIITQDALEHKGLEWAMTYASSITLGAGQFCTNPGLILAIQSPELDEFIEELQSQIEKIAPSCMLHTNIKGAFNELKLMVSNEDGVDVITKEIEVEGNYAGQTICATTGKNFLKNRKLHTEVFGPFSLVVKCSNQQELIEIIEKLEGQLTGTILAEDIDSSFLEELIDSLQQRVGRIILNGVPTGVEVCPAMNHGGPYPASSDSRFTAVGIQSIDRWIRPIAFQNFPSQLLPKDLKNE